MGNPTLTVQVQGDGDGAVTGTGTLSFEAGTDGCALMALRVGQELIACARVTQEEMETHAAWVAGSEDEELWPHLGRWLGFSREQGHLRVFIVHKTMTWLGWFNPDPGAIGMVLRAAALECKRLRGRGGAA